MGGMMRSPFTAVVFALELTEEIHALPVLLVASVTAYAFTVLVMRRSILTEKVARRGYDIFREYGVDPLERLRVSEVMTATVERLVAGDDASVALRLFQDTSKKHRGYRVVDADGHLIGMLTASDALERAPTSRHIADLLPSRPLIVAGADESCRLIAERMAQEGIGRMPVVDARDPRRIVGIITRSDLLKARLLHAHEENQRQTRRSTLKPPQTGTRS
jgi:CBS domain-containing protein